MAIRAWLYRNLSLEGAEKIGLSKANKWILAIILISIFVAIAESEPTLSDKFPHIFWFTNLLFAVVFSVEYILRLWAAGEDPVFRGVGGWFRYSRNPSNLIDVVVTLVLWVGLFSTFSGTIAVVFRFVRVLRLVRFIKQSAWGMAINALWLAVRKRGRELILSFVLAFVIIVLAATLLYLIEGSTQPDAFGSIPRAMWWAVATLTTIGYGDVYPVTAFGKFLAGFIGICSMALVALPTGILASAFSDAFQELRNKESSARIETPS